MPGRMQTGQALAEFLAAAGCLMLMLTVIPVLGRWLTLDLAVQRAAGAAVWERLTQGDREDDTALAGRINQSLRAGPGADWVDSAGVALRTTRGSDGAFGPAAVLRDGLGLSSRGLVTADIRLPLRDPGLGLLPASAVVLQARQASIGDAWTAAGPAEVIQRVEGSAQMHPYAKLQRRTVSAVNRFLQGVFREPGVGGSVVLPDVVPADRLKPYVP